MCGSCACAGEDELHVAHPVHGNRRHTCAWGQLLITQDSFYLEAGFTPEHTQDLQDTPEMGAGQVTPSETGRPLGPLHSHHGSYKLPGHPRTTAHLGQRSCGLLAPSSTLRHCGETPPVSKPGPWQLAARLRDSVRGSLSEAHRAHRDGLWSRSARGAEARPTVGLSFLPARVPAPCGNPEAAA